MDVKGLGFVMLVFFIIAAPIGVIDLFFSEVFDWSFIFAIIGGLGSGLLVSAAILELKDGNEWLSLIFFMVILIIIIIVCIVNGKLTF